MIEEYPFYAHIELHISIDRVDDEPWHVHLLSDFHNRGSIDGEVLETQGPFNTLEEAYDTAGDIISALDERILDLFHNRKASSS